VARIGLDITEGTVDSGYRGEIMIHVRNVSGMRQRIAAGDRIAQAVVVMLPMIEVVEVQELSDSVRGARGFGSSGR
jgi:dUTP pyrophosphatase